MSHTTPTPVANRTIPDSHMEAFDDADGLWWGVFHRGGFLFHLEVGTAQRTGGGIQRHLDVLDDVGWGGLRFGPVGEEPLPGLASRSLGSVLVAWPSHICGVNEARTMFLVFMWIRDSVISANS